MAKKETPPGKTEKTETTGALPVQASETAVQQAAQPAPQPAAPATPILPEQAAPAAVEATTKKKDKDQKPAPTPEPPKPEPEPTQEPEDEEPTPEEEEITLPVPTIPATCPLTVRAYLHVVSGAGERHPVAGDQLRLVAYVYDTTTGCRKEVEPSSVRCYLVRYHFSKSRLQFLNDDQDNTPSCWSFWDPDAEIQRFELEPATEDNRLFQRDFACTMGWGSSDVRAGVEAVVDGVCYTAYCVREFVGLYHRHDGVSKTRTGS